MKTYDDLVKVGTLEERRMQFIRSAINEHKSSELYRTAYVADEYARHKNTTITNYRKLLYTMSGRAVPDNFSANFKMASNFFQFFVTQESQYLLGNGVTWNDPATAAKLGDDFDTKLQEAAQKALIGGCSFGFFNLDHLEVFSVLEFVPLYQEDNGALKAGIRFWQVSPEKPLRCTLYELDGYTDYIWTKDRDGVLHEKRPYIVKTVTTAADGTEIYDFENYPSFPIVPLFANEYKQSEIIGLREEIDAYDLIKSGFANDLDDASQIYWTIQNAGGMDDVDLAKFIERMHVVKAAVLDDNGAQAQAHTLEVPYNAREALLSRLRADIFRDAMAFDPTLVSNGAITATQIKAAYEPLNSKTDGFEYQVLTFLADIMSLAGITDDAPTFTRSRIVNTNEEIQSVLNAAQYLPAEYVTTKILTLLGDGDKAADIIEQMKQAAAEQPEETEETEEEEGGAE